MSSDEYGSKYGTELIAIWSYKEWEFPDGTFSHKFDVDLIGFKVVEKTDQQSGIQTQGDPCPKCSNAWVKDVNVGTEVGFFRTTTTSLTLMTADEARAFLNDQEARFENRATFFSRASYALGFLVAKADWKVGITIGTIGFIGGEVYGDIAQRYDSVEAMIKSIHSQGVYVKIVDATSIGPRSTLSTKAVSVYTYDGQLIGELGY
jgi:hypothetical protein